MIESAQNLLTPTFFGADSTQLGSIGGAQDRILSTANLPPYTPQGSNAVNLTAAIPFTFEVSFNPNSGGGNQYYTSLGGSSANLGVSGSVTFTGTPQGGTSTPFATVQPTITCNYIIRIL